MQSLGESDSRSRFFQSKVCEVIKPMWSEESYALRNNPRRCRVPYQAPWSAGSGDEFWETTTRVTLLLEQVGRRRLTKIVAAEDRLGSPDGLELLLDDLMAIWSAL
jgi:hypothetical protein